MLHVFMCLVENRRFRRGARVRRHVTNGDIHTCMLFYLYECKCVSVHA